MTPAGLKRYPDPPASRRALLLVLSVGDAPGGSLPELRQGNKWADRFGFSVVEEVVEPRNTERGPDPKTWKAIRSHAALAIRLGAPNILVVGIPDDPYVTPWHFELLKLRIRRQLGLELFHTNLPLDEQVKLTHELAEESQGAQDDIKNRALALARRRNRGHGGSRAGGGRQRKAFSETERALLKEQYKPNVQGKGLRAMVEAINRMRGLSETSTRAERQSLGVGLTHVHKEVKRLGLEPETD